MESLLVSVIITNYNYGAYVAQAIESALTQTYRNLEVIVVDDASTDDSRDVISHYADRVDLVLQEHGGQLASTNAGFARCRGDVVILLDADDILFPASVSRHVAMLENPSVVKSQGYLQNIDSVASGRLSEAIPGIRAARILRRVHVRQRLAPQFPRPRDAAT